MTEVMAAYGDGLAAAAGPVGARAIHVYPVSNYTFGSKAAKADKDATVAEAMIRYKDKYEKEGMRRTCLLYTSPSPRDATLSRMPSSA